MKLIEVTSNALHPSCPYLAVGLVWLFAISHWAHTTHCQSWYVCICYEFTLINTCILLMGCVWKTKTYLFTPHPLPSQHIHTANHSTHRSRGANKSQSVALRRLPCVCARAGAELTTPRKPHTSRTTTPTTLSSCHTLPFLTHLNCFNKYETSQRRTQSPAT